MCRSAPFLSVPQTTALALSVDLSLMKAEAAAAQPVSSPHIPCSVPGTLCDSNGSFMNH